MAINITKKDEEDKKTSGQKKTPQKATRKAAQKPKVNRTSNTSKGLSDKQMDEITKDTGIKLNGEEKVKLIIPKIEGESDYVECGIKGYNYVIKKGVLVSVPRSVVEVLRNSKLL